MFRLAWKVHSTGYTGNGDWFNDRKILESHINANKNDTTMTYWIERNGENIS